MAGRTFQNAAGIMKAAEQMEVMYGDVTFPRPVEVVRTVMTRLEEAWQAALEAPPTVRAFAMCKVIERYAVYTGFDGAIQRLTSNLDESWQSKLQAAGWTPPNQTQVLPGLPAPEKQQDPTEGVKVIEVDE